MMSYRERIEKIKERGFFTGINGLSPLPPEKIPELYHDKKFIASDNWLEMLYAREYYRGGDERRAREGNNVETIDRRKALIFARVKKAETAFDLGIKARARSNVRNWILDTALNELLLGIESENERLGCLDAWLAGFHLADEETIPEEPEMEYGLDYDRMKGLRDAYETGDEPEKGTKANTAYRAYCRCVDLLDYQGCDIYRKCLSCPGKFRLLGDRSDRYGSEEFDYCEEDCAEADRTISDICAGYIEELEDYYIVQRSSEG